MVSWAPMRPMLAFPLLLSGCAMATIMGESSSPWFEAGPTRLPAAEVAAITRDLILRQGYRLPSSAAPNATRFVSDWDVRLSPHWREGYRTRVEAEVVTLDRGGLGVRVRSQREVNNEAGKPTIPEYAQWVSASLDEKQKTKIDEPALKIHQLLKFKLETR